MIEKQTNFYAYRGTNLEWGFKCKNNNEYKYSDAEDEYFGHGVYFFENDEDEAYNFAKYVRKIKKEDICIIYALIVTDKIFDLFDNKTINSYFKLVEEIIIKYKDQLEIPNFKKPFDCKLINYICEQEGYLLVKGPYSPNHRLGKSMYEKGFTRYKKTHIQLCVRDVSIIKECEVYQLIPENDTRIDI